MKICHFISSKGIGRGEFYVDLVNELSKSQDIYLLIPKNAKFLHRVTSTINIIEYTSIDSRNNPFLYIELFKIFKKYTFDIVHTHFAKSSEIFFRLNKILKTLHVATKHNPRKGSIFNKLTNVTAVSDDVAQSIKGYSTIIYNGINPIELKNIHKNDVFTVVAIGRLDKIKGFDTLIKESVKIKNEFKLNVVGDGDEKENLQNIIDNLKLNDKVELLGFKENIPEIINNADLVIMTSISEGFSIVMLESLFYAKVFISTRVSGCKDILTDDLLISNSEEISKKIDDVIKNYQTYQNSFSKIQNLNRKKFILKNIALEYISYYKDYV